MKSSTSLVKGIGGVVALLCAGIIGTTYATSLVTPQTLICATVTQDNTNSIKSVSVVPYLNNKPLSSDLWSSNQFFPNPKSGCASVGRDWLLGAAEPGTAFYVKGVDKSGATHLLEMRDVAMFRGTKMPATQLVDMRYHVNSIKGGKVPTLIGTVINEVFMDDKGKLSEVIQKGIYRSDMQDIYALDTMRQINATKYTKLADFKGKDTITREQAAKFFVAAWIAINPGKTIPPAGTAGCKFRDAYTMDHTLITSVNNACQLGLMKGSAGAFNPRNTLTLAEAITILIRMQYGSLDEKGNNIWYQGYFNQAYGVELFAHYAYNPHLNEGNDAISREMIAFLIRRLLEINNITPKYYNTI